MNSPEKKSYNFRKLRSSVRSLVIGTLAAGALVNSADAFASKPESTKKTCETKKINDAKSTGTFERCKYLAGTILKKVSTESHRRYETVNNAGVKTVDYVHTERTLEYSDEGKMTLDRRELYPVVRFRGIGDNLHLQPTDNITRINEVVTPSSPPSEMPTIQQQPDSTETSDISGQFSIVR